MEGGVVHLTLGGGEGDEGGLPPPPTTALAHGGAGVACLDHLLQVTVLKRGHLKKKNNEKINKKKIEKKNK